MIKKIGIPTLLVLTFGVMLSCGGEDASTLTHPPQEYTFPMYITVPGTAAGTGKILKLSAPATLDGMATVETLLTGLNFPTGIVVSKAGEIFFTEGESSSGRIMKISGGQAEELVTGLNNPQGLAFDSTGLMYVIEKGSGQLSWVPENYTSDEYKIVPLATDLTQPRSVTCDVNDNFYIAEPSSGRAVKVMTDGTVENTTTTVLADGFVKPMMVGLGLIGNLFVLSANGEYADGAETLITDGGNEIYLNSLINPKSAAWEGGMVLYVAEGAPVFRLIKYSKDTGERVVVASSLGDPHTIAFTPVD